MRRAGWFVRPLVGICLLASFAPVGGGCVGPVDPDELPEEPIAVTYWTREEARRRVEESEQRRGPQKPGVARLEDLGALLGAPEKSRGSAVDRYPGHLGLVDPRTGTLERVEAAPAGSVPLAWSADRSRLLLSARRPGTTWQLYEYLLSEREIHPLTHGNRVFPRGDYGPEGRLVHTSWGDGGWESLELSVTEPGGGAAQVVSAGVPIENVRWSPRGDMLLLVVPEAGSRRRRGPPRRALFAASPDDASTLRPLGRGRDPVFSADGEWIVYSAPVGSGWRLRRMRPDGSSRVPLGRGSVRDEFQPALSPDGSLVAFVAEDTGFRRLFVRRLDGSGERLLVPEEVIAKPVW